MTKHVSHISWSPHPLGPSTHSASGRILGRKTGGMTRSWCSPHFIFHRIHLYISRAVAKLKASFGFCSHGSLGIVKTLLPPKKIGTALPLAVSHVFFVSRPKLWLLRDLEFAVVAVMLFAQHFFCLILLRNFEWRSAIDRLMSRLLVYATHHCKPPKLGQKSLHLDRTVVNGSNWKASASRLQMFVVSAEWCSDTYTVCIVHTMEQSPLVRGGFLRSISDISEQPTLPRSFQTKAPLFFT